VPVLPEVFVDNDRIFPLADGTSGNLMVNYCAGYINPDEKEK